MSSLTHTHGPVPKGKKPGKVKGNDHKQPEYIAWLKSLFPWCEVHHLIHHKRGDRVRRDDRLVWPVMPEFHRKIHDRKGNEKLSFEEEGIPDIYSHGDMLWQMWCEFGRDAAELAEAYFREVSYGVNK